MKTPLTDRDTLDVAGLERSTEHVLSGGVHGVFVAGTTGEGPSPSQRLKTEMVERNCRLVARCVPVMVGVTDLSLVDALALAGRAADCGANAIVIAAPYYTTRRSPNRSWRGTCRASPPRAHCRCCCTTSRGLTGVGFEP